MARAGSATRMNEERILSFDGLHNFRDYGGYNVAGGGRLVRGTLYRSAHLAGAGESDGARLSALGIASVFDLRGTGERDRHPSRVLERIGAVLHAHDGDTSNRAPHEAAGGTGAGDEAAMREVMLGLYRRMPFNAPTIANLRRYFAGLAKGDGASLVHCMAGKDRTGFFVAMFHHAMGVSHADAMADYLLTNSAIDMDSLIAAGGPEMQARWGARDTAAMRVLMGVEEGYLSAAIDAITDRHGSPMAYLEEVAGLDETVRARLADVYIEGRQA